MPIYDAAGAQLRWPVDAPWSHSQLKTFEQCAKMYGEQNVRKNYPFVESDAMRQGKIIHKQFEDFVTSGSSLPLMLQPIGRQIEKLCAGAIEVLPERDVNLTWDLDACSWSNTAVSYRGRIDLTVVRPDWQAVIWDYKTGRVPDDPFEQIEYQGLALLLEKPKVKKVHGAYVYTKHAKRWMEPITRADIPRLVHAMTPRIERLKAAKKEDKFPPKPGGHCRYCPVIACKYNENRRAKGL